MPGKRLPKLPWPAMPWRPVMPDLSEGNCSTGAAGLPPDAWQDSPRLAVAACAWCPVLGPCREWALALPDGEPGVLGGLYSHERAAARRGAKRHNNGSMDSGGQG